MFSRLLKRIFPYGVIYHPGQITVIKRALLSETPLVFLPVLQSSMDSVIIQRLLTYQFGLPTICVTTCDKYEMSSFWSILRQAFRYE